MYPQQRRPGPFSLSLPSPPQAPVGIEGFDSLAVDNPRAHPNIITSVHQLDGTVGRIPLVKSGTKQFTSCRSANQIRLRFRQNRKGNRHPGSGGDYFVQSGWLWSPGSGISELGKIQVKGIRARLDFQHDGSLVHRMELVGNVTLGRVLGG